MRPYLIQSIVVVIISAIFALLYFFLPHTIVPHVSHKIPTLTSISTSSTSATMPVSIATNRAPTQSTTKILPTKTKLPTSVPKPASVIKPAAAKPVPVRATKQAITKSDTTHATSTPQIPSVLAQDTNRLRKALVNILCTTSVQSGIRSISGSGIIISEKGIILTNAHIGQYFLLTNYPNPNSTKCVIRTGSPAVTVYKATPIFISPSWIHENPKVLTEVAPTGTGKHDIALLAITKSATDAPLPTSFPAVALATTTPLVGEPVVIGSYAAQFLSTNEIRSSLYPTIVYGAIKNVYTLATTTIDAVSLGGTAAAQEGSSGGGILNTAGELVSTITTSSVKGPTASRALYAITASYIRRDYAEETSQSLITLLQEPTNDAVKSFAPEISKLTTFLTNILATH